MVLSLEAERPYMVTHKWRHSEPYDVLYVPTRIKTNKGFHDETEKIKRVVNPEGR